MAENKAIGSVFVRVRPRIKDFRRDTEQDIKKELAKGRAPEVPLEAKITEDSIQEVKREAKRTAREAGRGAKIRYEADFDGVNQAIKELEKKKKDLNKETLVFDADIRGLDKAIEKLQGELAGSKATIKFTPDERGHQQVLAKIEAIRREKAVKEIEFDTDDESLAKLERDTRAAFKELKDSVVQDGSLRYTADFDGVDDAIKQVKQKIVDLNKDEIKFRVDRKGLDNALLELNFRKHQGIETRIEYVDDEEGYNEVLKKIEGIRKSKVIPQEIEFRTDDASLARVERDIKAALKRVKDSVAKDESLKYSANFDGVDEAIKQVKQKIVDLNKDEIEFKVNRKGLDNALMALQFRKHQGIEARIEYVDDEDGYREVLKKIDEIRKSKIIPEEIEFRTNDASLDEVQRKIEEKLRAVEAARPIEFEFDENIRGYQQVLDRINEIRGQDSKIKLSFEADEESLAAVEAKAKEAMRRLEAPTEFRYKDSPEGNRKLAEKIREIQRERAEITVDLTVDDDDLNQMLAQATARSRSVDIKPRVDPSRAMFAEGTLSALARDRWVDLKPRLNARAMATLYGTFEALAGLNTVGDLVRQIEQIALNFDQFAISVGTFGGAIGSAISVGTVAMGSLLSIAGDTLQVFQGLAMAPALLLSGGAILQTWGAIWNDVGAALMGIPGVLEKMPPNAQKAVKAIEDMSDAINGVVQDNFWGAMNDEVARFTETLGPHVVTVMGNVATVMGRSISRMINSAEKLAKSGQLEEFTRNNNRFMLELASAAETAFDALMNMGIYGSKYLPGLGKWIKSLSEDFKSFMDTAVQTGKFDQWVRNSIKSIQSLGKFSKGTWDMLAGITKAFESVGGKGLHEMADGMERVAAWANSSGTQAKLEGIFRAAMQGASAVGSGFSVLMKQLWSMDDLVNDLIVSTSKLAGVFISQLSVSLKNNALQQGLVDIFQGMFDFIDNAGPSFDHIAGIFGRLGSIGGEVAREIARGMNLTMKAIDGFIERIQGPLINAIQPLTRVFEDVAAFGTPILFAMADSIGLILNLFSALPAPVQNFITLLGVLGRTGVLAGFGSALRTVSSQFSTMRVTAAREVAMLQRDTNAKIGATAQYAERRFGLMATTVQARMNTMRTSLGRVFGSAGLLGMLGGPWGLAITGAVAALGVFAGAQADAEERTRAVTNALQAQADGMDDVARKELFEVFKKGLTEISEAGGDVGAIMDQIAATDGDWEKLGNTLRNAFEILNNGELAAAGRMTQQEFLDAKAAIAEFGLSGKDGGKAARTLGKELQGAAGSADEARANIEASAAAVDGFVAASFKIENASPKAQKVADALKRLGDEASTAEDKASALIDVLDLLYGDGPTGDKLIAKGTKGIASTMDQLKRAVEEYDFGNAFVNGLLDVTTIEGAELHGYVETLRMSIAEQFSGEATNLDIKLERGDIDAQGYEDAMRELRERTQEDWNELGADVAKALGLTGDKLTAFNKHWQGLDFAPKKLETVAELKGLDQLESEFILMQKLGLRWSESEFEANFDVNNDGAVSAIEYADGLGKMFDAAAYVAEVNGDWDKFGEVINTARDHGYIWDGESFSAVLDADGNPVKEVIETALSQGYVFNGQEFIAALDADGEPVRQAMDLALEQGYLYDGTEFTSLLGADGTPTEDAIATMQTLGYEWSDSEWVSMIDIYGEEEAKHKIDEAKLKADDYAGAEYLALLQANADPALAESAQASAIISGEQYADAIYEATLKATGEEALATAAKTNAQMSGDTYATAMYWATLRATGDPALAKASQAAAELKGGTFADVEYLAKLQADPNSALWEAESTRKWLLSGGYSAEDYEAILRADGAPAIGTGTQTSNRLRGSTFARGTFRAGLTAIGAPALAVGDGTRKNLQGWRFAGGIYKASLTAKDNTEGGVKSARSRLNSLKDKKVTITTNLVTVGREVRHASGAVRGVGSQLGSLPSAHVKAFAGGGINFVAKPQTAHIASAGQYIMYAEQETGGEAFIPLASSKRSRSLAIWEETGRRLNAFADGGLNGGSTVAPTTTVNVTNNYPKSEPTSRTVREGLEYAALLGFN